MSFVFIHKQVENPSGTYSLISKSCYHLLSGMVSYAKLHYSFPYIILGHSLISMSTFFLCLLLNHSVGDR